jgi:hypothetical protein
MPGRRAGRHARLLPQANPIIRSSPMPAGVTGITYIVSFGRILQEFTKQNQAKTWTGPNDY